MFGAIKGSPLFLGKQKAPRGIYASTLRANSSNSLVIIVVLDSCSNRTVHIVKLVFDQVRTHVAFFRSPPFLP